MKKNVKKEHDNACTMNENTNKNALKSTEKNDVFLKKMGSNKDDENGKGEKKQKIEIIVSDNKESKRKKKNKLKEFFKKK